MALTRVPSAVWGQVRGAVCVLRSHEGELVRGPVQERLDGAPGVATGSGSHLWSLSLSGSKVLVVRGII